MEKVQNTKDAEQKNHIAKALGNIDEGYINYDDGGQVYVISPSQESEKLEIKEVDFGQLLNYPLKFTKCHFLQGLSVYKQVLKKSLFLKNVFFLIKFILKTMNLDNHLLATLPLNVLPIFTSVNLKKPLVFMEQPLKRHLIFHKLFLKRI